MAATVTIEAFAGAAQVAAAVATEVVAAPNRSVATTAEALVTCCHCHAAWSGSEFVTTLLQWRLRMSTGAARARSWTKTGQARGGDGVQS